MEKILDFCRGHADHASAEAGQANDAPWVPGDAWRPGRTTFMTERRTQERRGHGVGVASARRSAAGAALPWGGLCALVLVLDVIYRRGGLALPVAGGIDAVGHLATTLILLGALAPRASRPLMLAALGVTVGIDLDHLPFLLARRLGDGSFPGVWPLHNLLTLAAALAIGLSLAGRRRQAWLGIAFGVGGHFIRDMGSDGVALFAPLTLRRYELPYALYAAMLAAFALLAVRRHDRG